MAVSVVQTATPATPVGTTATCTFASPVTAGNTICASVSVLDGGTAGFTVAFTLGSSPDNWLLHRKATRSASGSNIYTAQWADSGCAGGASGVTVTLSGATGGFDTSIILEAWEVAGLSSAAEDGTGASSGSSTAYSTGSFTPNSTTTAADEFWWGSVTFGSSLTASFPSGWTNTAKLTTSLGQAMVAGYQVRTTTGSPLYSGTLSGAGGQWACSGATLKAGSISATATLAGHGTESAAGAIGGASPPAGEGTLTATPSGGLPDTWTGAGTGTLGATATETSEGTASLAGAGTLAGTPGTAPITVVNQWQGTLAQNPQFGPSLPAAPTCNVPLTHAASVGGGSGVPTPGNWLFAAVGWRQDPGIPGITIAVQDDGHQWNRPNQPSSGTGLTRCVLWYQPNIGAVTGFAPAIVYVAPSGYVASMSVLVFEVTGIGTWDDQVAVGVNYSGSALSLNLTLTL